MSPREAREALASARDRLLARADRIEDPALRRSTLAAVPGSVRLLDLSRTGLG
ncbi:hypothetical protein [Sorangium sp. So ce854]|uniref:hypothetical protein n=1 Tax=Sorangium sp. So ce854 TaxID=3133322 RepID=UPI003F5F4A61